MSFFDQNHVDVITDHVAWHGKMNQFMSELFLYAHKPMSYILWQSSQDLRYCFSYVVDICTIHHRMFSFDPDNSIWNYVCGQTIHQSKDLYGILQSVMQIDHPHGWIPILHASENVTIQLHKKPFP